MSDLEENNSPSERLKRSLPEDDDGHSDSDEDPRHARFKRLATGGDAPNDHGPSEGPGSTGSANGGGSAQNPGESSSSSSAVPMERDGLDEAQGAGAGDGGVDGDAGSATGGSVKSLTAPSISIRSLVTTKEAGVIIGKGGKNVSDIRDKSGARVTISEMVQGAYERILTVTGPLDAVAKVGFEFCRCVYSSFANDVRFL